MAKIITPLAPNVPIVDKDGNPTPYFQRVLQELTDNLINEIVLDGVGGDPGDNRLLVWDDTTGVLTFATLSDVIDWTEDTHGSILFRGATEWEALAPGGAGEVLTTNGAAADPSWEAPGAGGGYFKGLFVAPVGALDATAFATKGFGWTTDANIEVHKGHAIISSNPANSAHSMQIATVNLTNGTIGTVLGTSNTAVINSTSTLVYEFIFPTPVTIASGTDIAILMINNSGTGTTICRVAGQSRGQTLLNMPGILGNTQWRYNTIGVSASQASSSTTTASHYAASLEGYIV